MLLPCRHITGQRAPAAPENLPALDPAGTHNRGGTGVLEVHRKYIRGACQVYGRGQWKFSAGLDFRLRGTVRQAYSREDAFPVRSRWQGPPAIGPFVDHFDVQTIMSLGE